MRHGIIATGFMALIALSAHAQGSAKLAVGPDAGGYLCPDGRQIWVSRCYDQSAQASCQVVQLHIKNNGLNPETAATRAELLVSLKNCAITPLDFSVPGAPALLKPKALQNKPPAAAPTASPEAETYTVNVPGPTTPVSLLKIAGNDTSVHYVDEKSVKAPDKTGRKEIWELQVFPKGSTAYPKAAAVWNRYLTACNTRQLTFETVVELDQTGEMLTIRDAGGVTKPLTGGSIADVIVGMACNPATFTSERHKTPAAAIKAALGSAAAASKPAASVVVTPPGPSLALVNVSADLHGESTYYIDEQSVKPAGKNSPAEIWAFHVFKNEIPRTPGARAAWERYFVDCKGKTYSNESWADVDTKGKILKTWDGNHKAETAAKGSVAEWLVAVACKTEPLRGLRLTTIEDAIMVAYPPPPADPNTVGSKTPPGPATKTQLFRIGNVASSVWYVDAETFDPVPNAVAVVGWVLRVLTKPDPAFPGSSAVWLRYHFGCDSPSGSGGVLTKVEIDQTGKTRKTTASNAEDAALRPITEGTILEKLARTACYVDYPNIAPQLTVAAAIKDAAKPQ